MTAITAMNRFFLALTIILIGLAACASTEKNSASSVNASAYETESSETTHAPVISPAVPQKITFANQEFDFTRTDMFERFDRELTSVAYTHGATLLLMKRANKYFPLMAPILKSHGVPLDFLYLACVESSLNQRALSPAKAAGFWQFMPSTAREYGLEVNDSVDERYNLEKATRAAARYLKAGYKKYGNWESVAASYNAGMGRISRELAAQGQESSFDLYLNEETSRYMFRIFATKLILENPAKYGYQLSADQLYHPIATREIEVSTSIADLSAWAKKQGTSYQWVKELNPWLRGKSLPNKSGKKYTILVPENTKAIERPTDSAKVFDIESFNS